MGVDGLVKSLKIGHFQFWHLILLIGYETIRVQKRHLFDEVLTKSIRDIIYLIIHLNKSGNTKMDNVILPLKSLADKNRFHIIDLLLKHDFCVGALAHRLGISKAAVSQHLQILRKAGLVRGEKRGYWTHYSVSKQAIHELADDLKKMTDAPPSTESVCYMKCPDEHQSESSDTLPKCHGQCGELIEIREKSPE
jgi:DNA-binding transcriptional ArsR family regulator